MSTVIEQLKRHDDLYYNDCPEISDAEYDLLRVQAYNQHPADPYFNQVGSSVRGGKIPLPYPMGSLDQVRTDSDIENWLKRVQPEGCLVITDKLDGVSGLLVYNYGKLQIAYSRGNGVEGADITRHVVNMPRAVLEIPVKGKVAVRVEFIIRKDTFESKFSGKFKNARNMVAGCLNSKECLLEYLSQIYPVVTSLEDYPSTMHIYSRVDALMAITQLGMKTVESSVIKVHLSSTDHFKEMLQLAVDNSAFQLDGIVISTNCVDTLQKRVGNLNPLHSVKFKSPSAYSTVETTVVGVHWDISKSGYLKPRVEVDPVELCGTTVTFASGFNGRFIMQNNIGRGTTILITKSGDVIPHIVEVLVSTKADMPSEEYAWLDSGVEIGVSENHPRVKFKQALSFVETLGVEYLGEANLKKFFSYFNLWDTDFTTFCNTLFELSPVKWEYFLGANGLKVYNSLRKSLTGIPMAKMLGVLPFMGHSLGVRKFEILLEQVSEDHIFNLTKEDIMKLNGFGEETACQLVVSLPLAKKFLSSHVGCYTLAEKSKVEGIKYAGLNVVMTGFRDKIMEDTIKANGGVISSGVSTQTTHLVTKDAGSTSNKSARARELGIPIVTLREFTKILELTS